MKRKKRNEPGGVMEQIECPTCWSLVPYGVTGCKFCTRGIVYGATWRELGWAYSMGCQLGLIAGVLVWFLGLMVIWQGFDLPVHLAFPALFVLLVLLLGGFFGGGRWNRERIREKKKDLIRAML